MKRELFDRQTEAGEGTLKGPTRWRVGGVAKQWVGEQA